MRREGAVVSKATILEHVWDFAFDGDPNIVEVYVRHASAHRPPLRQGKPADRSTGRLQAGGGCLNSRDTSVFAVGLPVWPRCCARWCSSAEVSSLVGTLDRQLTSSRDDLSRSRVRDLIDQAAAGQLPAVLRNVNDDSVAQVFTEDGRVVSASANIQGRPPIVSVPTGANGEARTIRAPDDAEIETYRVWVETGRGPDGSLTVVEGTSLESVQEATSTLRRSLMVGVPLALLALCVVIWLVLGRALARLDQYPRRGRRARAR